MLIYGRQAVLEALREADVQRLLIASGMQKSALKEFERRAKGRVPIVMVPKIELDRKLGTTRHQGVAAELPELSYADPEAPFKLAEKHGERLLLVLLDQVQDPRNYGAIIRSAEVLGAHGVVTEERRSAPLSAVVAKTAAGATAHLPLVQVKNLPRYMEVLKAQSVWLYGAAGEAAMHPAEIDWERPAALVVGSEGTGMRRLVRDKCDELIGIPMRGKVASLNASVAAGILLYAVMEARGRRSKIQD
jgi:23S rRNA (guanosine2251-2'-O)-methyltransferase